MIYIIIGLLSFILAIHFDINKAQRGKKFSYRLLLLIFIVIPAIRFRVGGDTIRYMDMYYQFYNADFSSFLFLNRYLPLWTLLLRTLNHICSNFVLFQIVHAVFINSVFFWFFKKYSNHYFICVFLFYFYSYFQFNFETLAESISICFFLLGLESCINHKWVKYYTLVLIAVLFHPGAVILCIVPFFLSDTIKGKKIIILIILYFVLLFSWALLYDSFGILLSIFGDDRGVYIKSTELYNFNALIYGTLERTIVPFIIYIYGIKIGLVTRVNQLMFFVFFIAVLTSTILGLNRYYNYITVFQIVYFADLISLLYKIKNVTVINYAFHRVAVILIMVFVVYTRVITFHFQDTSKIIHNTHLYNRYYPYYTVFNPTVDRVREQLIDNW